MPHIVRSNIVGVFDSGVGGLSVLQAIHTLIPAQPLIYFADQAHVPYGSRTLEEVCRFSEGITEFLISLGARIIVVACNTASAAALHFLRAKYPEIPFVGMEPAVKPAAAQTLTGVVGVLATPATFQGELFASVVERFSGGAAILKDTCPGLVAQVERGKLDTKETGAILEKALQPMIDRGVDSIVLGCTHYPFVMPLIKKIIGEHVQVIDPSMPVARQVMRVLKASDLLADGEKPADMRFFTSGDVVQFEDLLSRLIGSERKGEGVEWGKANLRVALTQ